jgi:hypothetical protein
MVEIDIQGETVTFERKGLSELQGFRSHISVPVTSVRSVRRAGPDVTDEFLQGWRFPGAHVPGTVVAGTFYYHGRRNFWHVRSRGRDAIVVDLAGASYDRLIVDVPDPDADVARLEGLLRDRAA